VLTNIFIYQFLLKVRQIGIFEILLKGLKSVGPLFYFLSVALLLWTAYRFLSYLLFFYIRTKLDEKDLEGFIKILGDKYYFKKLGEGDKRYRWVKWYIVIKANFDNNGNRIYTRAQPFRFWHYTSVVSFI
jgi:hypothetical protein